MRGEELVSRIQGSMVQKPLVAMLDQVFFSSVIPAFSSSCRMMPASNLEAPEGL